MRRTFYSFRRHLVSKSLRTVITRFAPSPTGELHLGGLRTALYCFLASRSGDPRTSRFILRSEDTDRSRAVKGAAERTEQLLNWCGIAPDESPLLGGPRGPYTQSERLEHYRKAADDLLKRDLAFRCFCTPQRLDLVRRSNATRGGLSGYDGACASLSRDESERRSIDEKFTIRLRSKRCASGGNGDIVVHDLLRGSVRFQETQVDDFVLLKSDGYPTYHLASVVDDIAMEITHVIRGDEWLSSAPKHVLLYSALSSRAPQFIHVPLLLNDDGTKFSKRFAAARVESYKAQGYYPLALLNFIVRLGWSSAAGGLSQGRKREDLEERAEQLMTVAQMAKVFELENLQRGGAVVSMQKLDFWQKAVISQLAESRSGSLLDEFALLVAQEYGSPVGDQAAIVALLDAVVGRAVHVKDLARLAMVYLPRQEPLPYTHDSFRAVCGKKLKEDTVAQTLAEVLRVGLEKTVHENPSVNVMRALRFALSNETRGCGIAQMLSVLGTVEANRRISEGLKWLNEQQAKGS